MWATFEACARVRVFAAAAACGEAFGSKRVAARASGVDGSVVSRRLSVQPCGERARSKAAVTAPWRVDGARIRASVRQPRACCGASILIARDRARGMQRYFGILSGPCMA